jgi:drug/metabolite transporter (DMT)-like permease
MLAFGETLRVNVAIGSAIVVGAGLFTLWRERAAR